MQILDEIARELSKQREKNINKAMFSTGLVLGTMTQPKKVKLDNFKQEVDCIFFEYATNQHKRIVSISHDKTLPRDIGDKTEYGNVKIDDAPPPYTKYEHNFIEMQFEDVLKVGDRVLVAIVNNGSDHVVMGRVK